MPEGQAPIYTSWPMQGAMLPEGTGMKNGVDLAVAEAGGVVAGYCLEVVNLDDASPQTGKWDGAVEAENANKAVGRPAGDRLHRHLQLRRGQGLDPDQQPRPHGPDHAGQHLSRADQEAAARRPGEPEIYRPGGLRQLLPRPCRPTTSRARWAPSGPSSCGAKKVFILNDQELYGKGIADVFEAAAKKIGLQVVGERGHRLQAARPEAAPDQGPRLGRRPRLPGRRRRHGRPDRHPPDEGARPRGRARASASWAPTASSRRRC